MKILVFGANGMLGNYIVKYLSENNEVITRTRSDVDLSTVQHYTELEQYIPTDVELVVNSAGAIKPRMNNLDAAIKINAIWPHILETYCNLHKIKMIHISTDCVFYGDKGSYSESDKTNPADKYGLSKLLGEPATATIIRTSIIGEEKGQGRSLLEWVRSNANRRIDGYTNHFWNGVSCLRIAMAIQTIINTGDFFMGIRHVHSNHCLSKYELVSLVSDIYELNVDVNPVYVIRASCDRTLDSKYIFNVKLKNPSLREQIIEQKEYGL